MMNIEKQQLIDETIQIIKENPDIISVDEVLLDLSEYKQQFYDYELNKNPEIVELLNENKIRLKRAVKVELFKKKDATSLKELNKMLENEQGNDEKILNYINNLTERWFTGE